MFFGSIGKTRWPPWPLIGWDIFDFSSEIAEGNSTKLDRNQALNVLYQVCVFRVDRKKQDGRPGLWMAETFSTSPLKPLNGIQRNLKGAKISKTSTKFVFFGPIGKTIWPPWSLIGWDIFDFSSETAERNSTKLDRKQDINVLYQACVLLPISKQKCLPWLIPQKGGTLYSGARYVALRASCWIFSLGVGAFVIILCQISSFFSCLPNGKRNVSTFTL